MKETDPRLNDTRVAKSSGDVFVDLGFDKAEANRMALHGELFVQFLKPRVSTHTLQSTICLKRRKRGEKWSDTSSARLPFLPFPF